MSYITNEDIEKDLNCDLRQIKWAVGLIDEPYKGIKSEIKSEIFIKGFGKQIDDLIGYKESLLLIGSGHIGSAQIAMQNFKKSMDRKTFEKEVLGHWEDEKPKDELIEIINELPVASSIGEQFLNIAKRGKMPTPLGGIAPESLSEWLENNIDKIPQIEDPHKRKKKKVSNFKKRIDSFLSKKINK